MAGGSSYNGWPANSIPSRIGINQDWEPIPGHKFPGGIKSGDVEVVMTYFVRQLHLRVERIDRDAIKDEWGYNYKASANTPTKLSCHASGTAFDYNATRHPNGRRGTWSSAQVVEVRRIQAEVGGVVRWLYDATRVPDEMHFEIQGSAAMVKAVADRIRSQGQEMFTVGQFETLMQRLDRQDQALNDIKGACLILINELREFDADIAENDVERMGEVIRTVRGIADAVNAVVDPPNPG